MGARRARGIVLDAGALIAFERADDRMRAVVRRGSQRGVAFIVPAGVLAEVWRDGRRQARLASLVGHTSTLAESLDELRAKAAGAICGRSDTSDIVDASVVVAARVHGAPVVTTDAGDLRRIDPGLELHEL